MGRHHDLPLAITADKLAIGQRHFGLQIDQTFPTDNKHRLLSPLWPLPDSIFDGLVTIGCVLGLVTILARFDWLQRVFARETLAQVR
jgi:hypothetical protein